MELEVGKTGNLQVRWMGFGKCSFSFFFGSRELNESFATMSAF